MAYTQFFTSADCTVFVESATGSQQPVMLDTLASISFSEHLTSIPIFGISNPKFGFISSGNSICEGTIQINFLDPNYLYKALNYVVNGPDSTSTIDDSELENLVNATDEELENARATLADSDLEEQKKYARPLTDYPSGFNIKIILNNGTIYDSTDDKTYLIRNVKIVYVDQGAASSDDSIAITTYRFIAREINKETT